MPCLKGGLNFNEWIEGGGEWVAGSSGQEGTSSFLRCRWWDDI